MIRANPDLITLFPYRKDISAEGFSHTLYLIQLLYSVDNVGKENTENMDLMERCIGVEENKNTPLYTEPSNPKQ